MNSSWRIVVRRCGALCALAVAALLAVPDARAENVVLATGSMLGGKQSWTSDLNIQAPGVLSMRVSDLGVPYTIADRLESLSFSVMSPTGVLASRMGEGLLAVDVSTPGLYFLHISAVPKASSRFQLGLVSWNATYAPVPLPAAVWFLIAGVAWAMGLQRRRAKLGADESGGLLPWSRGVAPAH